MAFAIIDIKNNVNLKETEDVILLHAMKAHASVKLQLHTFLTSATDERSGLFHAPGRFFFTYFWAKICRSVKLITPINLCQV